MPAAKAAGAVGRAVRSASGPGALLARIDDQLLYAPVQDFGDVDLVLRRAGDLVDPAELLGLLARAAEPAEHGALAVERDLVDAAREGVGDIRHLVGAGGDADRPRGPRRLGAAGREVVLQ